jgi:hypothetical protein
MKGLAITYPRKPLNYKWTGYKKAFMGFMPIIMAERLSVFSRGIVDLIDQQAGLFIEFF